MCSHFLDPEVILLGSEQWTRLDQKWGTPVDLEINEDIKVNPTEDKEADTLSTIKNKSNRTENVKFGTLDYKQFMKDLKDNISYKQCYFTYGEMLSADSLELIRDQIDDLFKSVERLYPATSTVRVKNTDEDYYEIPIVPKSEKVDEYDYIDEILNKLSYLSNTYVSIKDEETRESVTTLVKKFSLMLAKPIANCVPKKRQKYDTKFKELIDFWNKVGEHDNSKTT